MHSIRWLMKATIKMIADDFETKYNAVRVAVVKTVGAVRSQISEPWSVPIKVDSGGFTQRLEKFFSCGVLGHKVAIDGPQTEKQAIKDTTKSRSH